MAKAPADISRKSKPIGFRPTPALREKLQRASSANERSLSQEINSRIERSMILEDLGIVSYKPRATQSS